MRPVDLRKLRPKRNTRKPKRKSPKSVTSTSPCHPPSIIAPQPSQYAIQKISAFDFVELWYFSPEGCSEAACNHKSQADDMFGLSNTNEILTLHPVASVRVSRNARANYDLLFSEFLQAKNAFLYHIKQATWPDKHVNALAEFFWNLKNHSMHVNENGDLIALHYAFCIHRQWHDELKSNSGNTFNILIINDNLMNSIAFEMNSNIQAKVSHKVNLPLTINLHTC
ncbi:hypothetical protein J3R82DRAFT_9911 [Butyriboletus roseoflavus]|nr:hypothetical protein J3R82DRAFT_9911 [Butyriboletus roseoflavus]